jgi:hypothetical protein
MVGLVTARKPKKEIRGRCYDHNFLRFFPIFVKKIGVFLKNQCYDHNFAKTSSSLCKKANFSAKFFGKKNLKNHSIGPWSFGRRKPNASSGRDQQLGSV